MGGRAKFNFYVCHVCKDSSPLQRYRMNWSLPMSRHVSHFPMTPTPSPPPCQVALPAQVTQVIQVPLILAHEPLRHCAAAPVTRHSPSPPPIPWLGKLHWAGLGSLCGGCIGTHTLWTDSPRGLGNAIRARSRYQPSHVEPQRACMRKRSYTLKKMHPRTFPRYHKAQLLCNNFLHFESTQDNGD